MTHEFMEMLRQLKITFWMEGEKLHCKAPAGVLTPELQKQIMQNKAELIELVKKHVSTPDLYESEILPRSPETQKLPLSFAQQRLWFLWQLEPENPANNCFYAMDIQGPVEIKMQNRCLTEVIRRHESLRTTFSVENGEPIQVVHPPYDVSLPLYDLRAYSSEAQKESITHLSREMILQPYDLEHGPLIRYALIQRGEDNYILLLGMHHIIVDGWSLGVIIREVVALFTAYQQGKPSPLPDLPIQYADFALWQRHMVEQVLFQSQLEYWRSQLSSARVDLPLPFDKARPMQPTFAGGVVHYALSAQQVTRLKTISQSEGATIFMTMLAAFQLLLMRYTGQDDIAVGTLIANRNRAEIEGLVGFFVNTLVMRVSLAGDPTIRELLQRVREVALKAYANQDLPFEKLVEELRPERMLNRLPFVQVSFDFHNMRKDSLTVPGFSIEPFDTSLHPAIATEIAVEIDDDDHGGLDIGFYYQSDLFEQRTIVCMLDHYIMILDAIVHDPRQRLSCITLLSEKQRQLLSMWNGITDKRAYEQSALEWLEESFVTMPDAVALIASDRHVTYRELYQQASTLAYSLQRLEVGQEQVVALLMDRGIELVTAMIAILQTGGAFLLLDPQYPHERLASMLQQGQVRVLVTSAPYVAMGEQLAMYNRWPDQIKEYCTLLSASLPELDESANVVKSGDALAYVLYTSGSTGQPKGAMISQRGMMNHLYAKIQALQISAADRLAQTASQSFDIVIWQCLAGLLVGATVCIIDSRITYDPQAVFEQVEEQGITILELVPSFLHVHLNYATTLPPLHALRYLLLTGEQLSPDLVRQWQSRYVHIPVVNAYGPTECSDDVAHCIITCPLANGVRHVPIGKPIGNISLYILDQHMQLLAPGLPGELYIGGKGVGRGYIGQPARTSSAFLPDPYTRESGARLYKTGDRARWTQDGQIAFLGRIDQQVKLRGFRIELEEVETVLHQHALVQECAALLYTEEGLESRLVAYVVLKEAGAQWEEHVLRRYLERFLPGYMVPEIFVELDCLPRLPNGKLDRRALPAPDKALLSRNFVAPRTPIEHLVAACWCKVLGLRQIGVHDSFFELGGHSLLATRLISHVRTTLQVELPLRSIFEAPTVAKLTERVEMALCNVQEQATPAIIPVSREQELPLSFAQQRLWFLNQLDPKAASYNVSQSLRMKGVLHIDALEHSIQEVVRRHEILRTVFEMRARGPVQVVKTEMSFALIHIDIQRTAGEEREAEIHRLLDTQAYRPFDLSCGPLLRGQLLYLDKQEYILSLTMHHIIIDGWSFAIFFREVATLYDAFIQGKPSPLLALPIQYADFAFWQRQWLQEERLHATIAYWEKQLRGASALELPTDHSRSDAQNLRGALYSFDISSDLSQALVTLSIQESVTLFMTMLTAFQVLLHRYTGQTDIVVGTGIANRTRTEIEPLIGYFVNPLALRMNLGGKPSFRRLLGHVRKMILSAYSYQDMPFEMLVEILHLERKAHLTPLINVMFMLQNVPTFHVEVPDLILDTLNSRVSTSNFDIVVFVSDISHGLQVSVNYSTDLFEAATIARMFNHFEVLLNSIIASPDMQIAALEMYSEAEKVQRAKKKSDLRNIYRHKLLAARGESIDLPRPEVPLLTLENRRDVEGKE